METAKFRQPPPLEVDAMTFPADEKSLESWLSALPTLNCPVAAKLVLQAILSLEALPPKANLRLKLLHRLSDVLPVLVEPLQKTYLDNGFPLSRPALDNVELVVWNYLAIAHVGSKNLFQTEALSQELQAAFLYVSLKALTHALLHISLSYLQPPIGFWQLCFQLYAYAEHAKLLDYIPVIAQGSRNNSLRSIDGQFKHLLVFYLCDTQQFRSRELLTIFQQLAEFAHEAVILTNYHTKWQHGLCVFSLKRDVPPSKITMPGERHDSNERFICSLNVAKHLSAELQQKQENNALVKIHQVSLVTAINTLGLTRKRKFTRVTESLRYQGIIGFTAVIEYLRKHENWIPAPAPSHAVEQIALAKALKSSLDLIPAGEEQAHQMQATYNQSQKQNASMGKIFAIDATVKHYPPFSPTETDQKLCWFSIHNSSAKGYGLTADYLQSDVRIGDVIGLSKESNATSLEICLIRRISQLSNQSLDIGLEVLGFDAQLVLAQKQNLPSTAIWALLIPAIPSINQPERLIYNHGSLQFNDIISIKHPAVQQEYRMQKTLLINAAIIIMQLERIEAISLG